MKRSNLAIRTLSVFLLAGPLLASANPLESFVLNGAFLTSTKSVTTPANIISEEIVVTAARIPATKDDISPSLKSLFSSIDLKKTQQKEMEWLSTQSKNSLQVVQVGYDPEFDFLNKSRELELSSKQSPNILERTPSSLIRVRF